MNPNRQTYEQALVPRDTIREREGRPPAVPHTAMSDLLLAGLLEQVSDPRVRLALVYCQDQIQEPSLGLAQLQEVLSVFRPNGGPPCCRTVQRWVEKRGLPCSTDGTNNRRIYFLSQVLAWWKENFRTKSIGEDAMDRARERLLKGPYRPGSAQEHSRLRQVS